MRIYHTETREDYDALMVELEGKGFKWAGGSEMLQFDIWNSSENLTSIRVYGSEVNHASLNYYKEEYPYIPITKYKAKADEKMRFTKENVYKMVERYRSDFDYLIGDLKSDIFNLDDTPEKVVVPKFVAEFYEERKYYVLGDIIGKFQSSSDTRVKDWFHNQEGSHRLNIVGAHNTIAKMHLYGYTIEPEKLYYIPLPHLETPDGLQQVLSKSKKGDYYFANRPSEIQKQHYTKEELERVPEIYKPYAKPIEEESE